MAKKNEFAVKLYNKQELIYTINVSPTSVVYVSLLPGQCGAKVLSYLPHVAYGIQLRILDLAFYISYAYDANDKQVYVRNDTPTCGMVLLSDNDHYDRWEEVKEWAIKTGWVINPNTDRRVQMYVVTYDKFLEKKKEYENGRK